MRNNLFKAFVSAVAGSALLLVALFVMNVVRPETAVVEAAPAVAAPSLAATNLTTVTMMSEPTMPMYTEVISSWIVRDEMTKDMPMTATVMVNGKWLMDMNKMPVVWDLKPGVITSEFKLADNWYPGSYYVTATVYMSGTMAGYAPNNGGNPITVMPMIKFDSGVPAEVKLGEKFSATVKIQPEVNVMSNTNEIVEYDFQNDGTVDASVIISSTNSYTKSDKPDATYVYTDYMFMKGMTYTMKAAYKSGIYGNPMATVTKTISVKNPTLTVNATPATVKVGEQVSLEGMTDFAVDTASVMFSANGTDLGTVAMSGTNATTTTTFAQVGEYAITGKLMAFGNEVTTSAPVTVTVESAQAAADTVVASAAKAVEAGSTTTVSATVTGNSQPVAGQVVSFTIQAGSSTISPVTATTNDQGVAEVTLTGGLASGEKYETTIVHANLPGTTVAPSPVSIVVYAQGAEVPNVVDGATVEADIAGTTDTVVNTTVPAGANQATFQVTVKAGTTITLTDGTSVSLAGGKIVVTPIVSPTNEATLKTTSGGDTVLFGVIVDVYYRDANNNLVKAGSGTVLNPAISITVTFGNAPVTLTTDNVKVYYLNDADSTWKNDGITITAATATSVTFSISHLTQFGGTVQSTPPAVYLPFIMRASTTTTTSTVTL